MYNTDFFMCREDRERYIRAKYVDKEFLADLPRSSDPLCAVSFYMFENVSSCMYMSTILLHSSYAFTL